MSQINLMTGGGEGSNLPRRSLLGGSFFFSIVVLALAFGSYFGVIFYRDTLQKQVDEINARNEAARNRIAGEKADRVADFADRLSVIDQNLKKTSLPPNDPFSRIERALMPEANITSYSYDIEKKEVKTGLAADSFRAIAQQIITLKREGSFSSATIDGDVKLGTSGKVEALFVLSL